MLLRKPAVNYLMLKISKPSVKFNFTTQYAKTLASTLLFALTNSEIKCHKLYH